MKATPVSLLLTALIVVLESTAAAEVLPAGSATDTRIRTVAYQPDQVYRLQGHVGYALELVFEEGERYQGQGGGDLDGLSFGAHHHHLILKPKAAGVDTNFVVFTDRRTYRFHYSVAEEGARSADVMYAVTFTYPPRSSSGAMDEARRVDRLLDQGHERILNRDFYYCGHAALRPSAASDDGVQTRLAFGARKDWPAVFVRHDDGTESLLNFHIDQGEMVIHRVARQFVLRRGKLTGCVVNRGYGGAGERLESGTVSPRVERTTLGVQP